MSDVKVYGVGICAASACIPHGLSSDEVEREVNRQHMTGLDHGWQLSKAKTFATGEPQPCPCNDNPQNRIHVLLEC